MSEYLPIYKPGQAVTLNASAAVTGGQVVAVSGDGTVAPAPAKSAAVVGVAAFDVPQDADVTIYSGGVQSVKASGAITAGDKVSAAASGAVALTTSTDPVVGLALSTAADGAQVRVRFNA